MAKNNMLAKLEAKYDAYYRALYVEKQETLLQMAQDAKEDEQMWYAKAKCDERIKAIVGEENFAPWEERYRE